MRKILMACAATVAMTGAALAGEMQPGSGGVLGTAAPGKVIVRFDSLVAVAFGFAGSTLDKANVGAVNVKNDPYGMMMYARFYPALDAQTAGGLRYGAAAEVRANNNTGATGGVGVGVPGNRNTNTLYWNRAYGYIGGDSWGTVRFGMVDGPINLMSTGSFQNFADGGWNGTAPGMTVGLGPWQSPIGGSYEYAAQKLSYTSPQFAGFDIGVSFAPSTATHQGSDGGNVVTGGSSRQATSVLPSDANRYRNSFQVNTRWRGNIGAVGIVVQAGYVGSGVVSVPGIARRGLSIFDAGAQINYMGFTVGGHVDTGTFNGNMNLSAPGEKAALWWVVGASYETGPWTVGAHFIKSSRPGALGAATAQQKEVGIAAGVTYAWAPGVRTFVEVVQATRSEKGANLNIGTGAPKDKISGAAVVIGQAFRW